MPREIGSSTWDQAADRDLFLAIIAEGELKTIKWGPISAKMQTKGYTFSANACRQHFQKLRKEANGELNSSSNTPTKGTNAGAKQARPASSKKRKVSSHEDVNGSDDDEEIWGGSVENTPSKKRKKESVKKQDDDEDEGFVSQNASSFKTENEDDGGIANAHQVIDLENDDIYDREF